MQQIGRVYKMGEHTLKQNYHKSFESELVASTTQTQGNGAITAQINKIVTVANDNDTITLPTAREGDEISIINGGAKDLQIYPASGDDLGNGLNQSMLLETNERIKFFAEDTIWTIEDTTQVFHAEIHDEDNTTSFTINTTDEHHAYHSSTVVSGDLAGWTFDSGSNGAQVAISGIADATGGNITVTTSTSHNIDVGDTICHTGLSDSSYVGFFTVLTKPSSTTYTVTATYAATGTGFMSEPSYIQVKDIATGKYLISWTASLSAVGSGVTFDFFLHDGMSVITGSKGRHRISNASTFKMIGGQSVRHVVSSDRIFFALSNTTNATNLTIRDFSLITIKL